MDEATARAYASHAREYADAWAADGTASALRDAAARYFVRGATTLDVGCGSGRDVDWLNHNGYPCIGIDASRALLDEARERYPAWRFERGELPGLDDIPDDAFSQVVCETVIQHLPSLQVPASIASLLRVCRPGGVLFLSWRITEPSDRRDDHGRLYAAIAPSLVDDALTDAEVLVSMQNAGSKPNRPVHIVIARRRAASTTPSRT